LTEIDALEIVELAEQRSLELGGSLGRWAKVEKAEKEKEEKAKSQQ
jgi:hypothetical protein